MSRVRNREVVLSDRADWMPLVDVIDVVEVHHWTKIESALLDIAGRAQAYWLRYKIIAARTVRKSKLVGALGADPSSSGPPRAPTPAWLVEAGRLVASRSSPCGYLVGLVHVPRYR